jgi:TonB family protein
VAAAGATPKVIASVSPGEALLGASASVKAPVAVRIVSPAFPSTWRSEDGQVDASFQIAADGSLRDIRIADNGAGAAFVRAAERALKQWRFDPRSLSGDRSARFRQSFVFAASAHGSSGNRSENSCVTSTGSLICRPIEDAAPVTTISMDSHR